MATKATKTTKADEKEVKPTKTKTESVKKTTPRKKVAKATVAKAEKTADTKPAKAKTPKPVTHPEAEKPADKSDEKKTEPTKAEKPSVQQTSNFEPEYDLKEMLDTGAHFGHQAKRWHPKMAPYIYAKRDGVHIFDLLVTADQLKAAAKFAYSLGKQNKTFIFVGTKRQAREIVKAEATRAGAMYIINRWLGGMVTNWDQVSKSIKRMIEIRKGLEENKFKHYTKKERVMLDKEAQRLERFFGGISTLKSLPDALFVIDVGREDVAVKEASENSIPVIAMVDTNDDPTPIDFVIPANDDAARSLEYFIKAIADAYLAGKNAKK